MNLRAHKGKASRFKIHRFVVLGGEQVVPSRDRDQEREDGERQCHLKLSKKGKVSPWSVGSPRTVDIGHTMSI